MSDTQPSKKQGLLDWYDPYVASCVVYADNHSLLRLSPDDVRKCKQEKRQKINTTSTFRRSSVAQGSPQSPKRVCRRSTISPLRSCVICFTIGAPKITRPKRKQRRKKLDQSGRSRDRIRECLSSRPINCVTNLEGESYVWEVCEPSLSVPMIVSSYTEL